MNEVRTELGRRLAAEQPAEADVVVPVPDSGVCAATGFAEAAGLPLQMGLIRNHYVGRTFIEPEQARAWVDDYHATIASSACVPGGFAVNPRVACVLPFMCHADEATAGGLLDARAFTWKEGLRDENGRTWMPDELKEWRGSRAHREPRFSR